MLTLPEVVTQLQDRRLSIVAEGCGVHENILRRIRDGENTNPEYETLKAVSDYLAPPAQAAEA